jgi:restriction system protein
MRRLFVRILLTCCFIATLSLHAQVAPDIARGTSAEDVIRLYGWPRGKGISEDREIWTYDAFNVAFLKGSVVAVTPRRPVKGESLVGMRKITRDEFDQQVRSAPRPQPTTIPNKTTQLTATKDQQPIVRRVAADTPAVPIQSSRSWFTVVGPVAILFCGLLIGAILLAERRRAAREVEERMRNAATMEAKKTWQESMADQLKRANGQTVSSYASTSSPISELSFDLLNQLEWKRIERLVALYFQASGIRAECTQTGADGGVDVHLFRSGDSKLYAYVQCKAWIGDVNVKLVRELFGVMAAENILEGYFVTTGSYTPDAITFAKGRLVLVDGQDLVKRINNLPLEARSKVLTEITQGDYRTPTCPRCDVKLLFQETGTPPYWRCNVPRCRYTMTARKQSVL